MVRANNEESIRLDHIVVFERDNQVFAAAREQETGRICLFLVDERTGDVYARDGRAQQWTELYGEGRSSIVSRIYAARHNRNIPVYNLRAAFSA